MNNRFFVSLAVIALSLTMALPSLAAPASRTAGEVVIINTGDRLTPGYRVTVEANGKISGTLTPRRGQKSIHRTDHLIPPVRRRFFADLAAAEPLEMLPLNAGQQRAGSTRLASSAALIVRYGGKQSPNLRDAGSMAGKVLLQDVEQVIGLLRFPVPEHS